jgi:hypothetical protein
LTKVKAIFATHKIKNPARVSFFIAKNGVVIAFSGKAVAISIPTTTPINRKPTTQNTFQAPAFPKKQSLTSL